MKVSTDPRITTAVVLNSGMITDDDHYMIRHELKRSVLDQMHAPIAYFIGGETDIAYANSETTGRICSSGRFPHSTRRWMSVMVRPSASRTAARS